MKPIRFLVIGLIAGFFLAGCAGKKTRDSRQIYLDEIKYTKKAEISYVGLFTSHPVKNFYADKLLSPPSIVVNMESVDTIQDPKLPRYLKDDVIEFIDTKVIDIEGRKYGQVNVMISQDADFSIKQTEYGLRLDIKPIGGKFSLPLKKEDRVAKAPLKLSASEKALEKDLEEIEKAEEKEKEELPKNIEELEKTEMETGAPKLPSELEAPEPQSITAVPKILESITRTSTDNKERITLTSSEPIEYQSTLLDREIIIELKDAAPSNTLSPIVAEEPESYLTSVDATHSQAPYPSTKVNIAFKESIIPIITQNGNLIHVDFLKPKMAKVLEEPQMIIDFGNYLSSPSRMPGRAISLQTKDTDLYDIFRLLSETSDYNIIAGKDISGKVTTRLINVPWDEAFIAILQAHQLGFVKQGNILRIATLSHLKEEKEKAAEALLAKNQLEPLRMMFIPLNNRKAGEIVRHVYPFLSSRGSLSIDRATNTIIMRDIESALGQAKNLVSSLDVKK